MTGATATPLSEQRCAKCGTTFPDTDASPKCTRCGGLLEVVHAPTGLDGSQLRALFAKRRAASAGRGGSGVWRYQEIVLPGAGDQIVSHSEGNTPLLARDRVASWAGVSSLLPRALRCASPGPLRR